ncbi:MAG: PAS domain-containing protein [Chloroflexota bacterium]|nr:PAS domain-containing protein [Chloroflexota bacterium]MDQ5866669.1 PAS domain-containing protein [Chloroflexota bacterium]
MSKARGNSRSAASLKLTTKTSPNPDASADGTVETDTSATKVLLVESDRAEADLLQSRLVQAPGQYQVLHVTTLAEATQCLASERVQVVLLDLALHDSSGLATYTLLQPHAPEVPVVILSSADDEALAFAAIQQGAQDYLIKEHASSYMLERSIGLALECKRLSDDCMKQSQELEAQRRTLAALIDNIDVSMIVLDSGGHLTLVNDCWTRRYHIPGEAVLGRRFDEIEDYPVSPDVQKSVDKVLATGEPVLFHEWYYSDANHPQGMYVDGSILPIVDADGKVTGASSISIDVTEKVRARQAVEASNAILETIIEATPVGLAYFDCDMRILNMNSTYAQWGFLDGTTAIGKVLYDLRESARAREHIHRRVLAGESIDEKNIEVRPPAGNHPLYYDVYYRPVRAEASGEIIGMVSAVVDVTGRMEIERQKDNFLTLASHELRTPITSIKGYTELLLRNTDLTANPKNKHFLEVIHQQVNHLVRLVNDLVDVSRIERDVLPMHRETFNLSSLASKVAYSMRLLAPAREIKLDFPANPVLVNGDRDQLQVVLQNLLENALKYAPEDEPVEVSISASGAEAVAAVRDYGVGVPHDQQSKVFERFYRATNAGSRPRNGLGLGLFLARSVVERHGGRIWVESRQGQGSTFYFALPLAEDTGEGY